VTSPDRIAPYLRALPPEVRASVARLWETLPPDLRVELRTAVTTIDGLLRDDRQALQSVMELVGRTVSPAFGAATHVVVVGPVNVGKSSLYNALLASHGTAAEVSPIPGSTREVQTCAVGPFRLTDTPGAENWADFDHGELDRALGAARDADFLLVVLDASRGVLAADRALYERIRGLGRPHLVTLNKIDLIARRQQGEVRGAAAAALGLEEAQIIPVSALAGVGVDRLLLEIAVAEPRLLGYLGALIPSVRRKLAWQATRRATVTAMGIALIPLPFVDLLPLAAVQASLILSVGRVYGRPLTLGRAGELVGTFGVGLLGRTLFHELVKLGGVPGWVLAASIAGATTMSIGAAATQWLETGRKPARREVAAMAKSAQARLGGILREAFRRKPSRRTLSRRLDEALSDEPPEE
jgi:small GTP-binding protein